ncbi:MAG TPA: hypothetical protein PK200_06925 [Spirochaetota bacterium]|nr:hypothetical protein [Spirochaetota bacterium]HQO02047.1 hypothetical protein [Spirochaetota bacterium]HQP47577.1 hypothetical protein [Spirochaetota bacterium]
MEEQKYILIINKGEEQDFVVQNLEKIDFLRATSTLLKKPKKIFLGMGDFLEIGDYNNLLDSIFFETEGIAFENILDDINSRIAEQGNIPFSFLKLAVYFPDFLLKDVPVFCSSIVGKKSRLFPGAENFTKYIKEYNPIILSALPYEIAIEFTKRLGLHDENLISTEYRVEPDDHNRPVYAGGIKRFISGDRKSLEIEKSMATHDLKEDEIVYIGRGEAGTKTFSTVNSIAFNPSQTIIPESRLTIYGSSLESLLVLFNFDGDLEKYLMSDPVEEFLPSLVVYSETRKKSKELIDIELQHRQLQSNVIGQRIECSGESYKSVRREIEVEFGGSTVNMREVKHMVEGRMHEYRNNLDRFIREISMIAVDRYKNIFISEK